MTIDDIREQLAKQISHSEEWINKLNESNPGHYGVEDWEVSMSKDNIWVEMPNRAFTFKKVNFDFQLLIGSSNPEDGLLQDFSRDASGKGTFEYISNNIIKLEDLDIEFDLDLFR